MSLDILVLGPVEARLDGRQVALGGPKQKLVLALLTAHVGRRVSLDRLVECVWGEDPPDGARRTAQTYLSNLRGEVGDVIQREGDGYVLSLDATSVDARRFEDAVREALPLVPVEPALAVERLRVALALWRGHPYADVDDRGDLLGEVARLDELRLAALEARMDAELAAGQHAEVVPELESLTTEHPMRERFRQQQMLALYRCGRQADALRVYHRTRETLAEELGIEPSPRLRELEVLILNQDPALDLEPRTETHAFLFVAVDDGGASWETDPGAVVYTMPRLMEALVAAIDGFGGRPIRRAGETLVAVFPDVADACRAAQGGQQALATAMDRPVARMAIDTGDVEVRGSTFSGPPLARAERILASAHWGQVLLSRVAHSALVGAPGGGWKVRALGEIAYRGLPRPERVFQLAVDGLPDDFPPPRLDRRVSLLPGTDFGRIVRGYELRERIGVGDFGVVYRAYQPSVGREVAVKLIRPEYASQPAFIRRFEAEAQLIARLEHPHIVALYDFWRDPEGACLVTRWMRGGSLRRALERGPWNVEPTLRLLDQISSALDHAHRQGVVHRDLKPANVLLDEDGNAYLSDFGLAARLLDASEARRPVSASPAYIAPEESAGLPQSVASDVYALGVLAFELLTGEPPLDPSAVADRRHLPAAVAAVLARATRTDPTARFASPTTFVAALHHAAGTRPAIASRPALDGAVRNPYKGLRAFGETDAADFHGREDVVAGLAAAVADRRFVALVGPSGIGKSSVIRAGLVPSLRAGLATREWLISVMTPGSFPFDELHAALLRVSSDDPPDVGADLVRDEHGLLRAVRRMLPAGSELVLVVDQFEELFTLVRDEDVRARFLAALAAIAHDPGSRVRIVATLRADYFDRPLGYPGFGELLGEATVPLAAPKAAQLAEAVAEPARAVGVELEPGLVERVVRDVEREPGGLPLLQYAMTEVFSARTSQFLTVHGYEATGGVIGALGRRTEALYGELTPERQALARRILVRMVAMSDGATVTRRRVRRREFDGLAPPMAIDEILDRFGAARLLTFDRDAASRSPTIELAHEALLDAWPRLAGWLAEDRESLALRHRLSDVASEWLRAGQDEALLYRGSRLAGALEWADAHGADLNADERSFLDASSAAARRASEERDAAARRELEAAQRVAEAERRRADDSATSSRRSRRLAAGLALAVTLALGGAAAAAWLRGEAEARRIDAEQNSAAAREQQEEAARAREEADRLRQLAFARELAAVAVDRREADPEQALLIALEAVAASRAIDGAILPEVEVALRRAVQASPLATIVPGATGQGPDGTIGVISTAWSADGTFVASGGRDGVVTVWRPDGATLQRVWSASVSDEVDTPGYGRWNNVVALAFSIDGRELATAGADGTVRVLDAATGRQRFRVRHDGPVWSVAFDPGGTLLASGGEDGTARLWQLPDGEPIAVLDHWEDTEMRGIAAVLGFAPDGRLVTWHAVWQRATGTVRTWEGDPPNVREVARRSFVGRTVGSAALSPDGSMIAVGGDDARVHLLDARTLEPIASMLGHSNSITGLAFDSSGARLATHSTDETVRVWDLSSRQTVLVLRREHRFEGLAWSPDGRQILTGEFGGDELALWDTIPAREAVAWGTPRSDRGQVNGPALIGVTPDGGLVIRREIGDGTTIDVWDPSATREPASSVTVPVRPGDLMSAAVSPDGRRIATAHGLAAVGRAEVRIWDAGSGALVRVLDEPPDDVTVVAFSPDGTRLFAWSFDGTVRAWSMAGGHREWIWTTPGSIDEPGSVAVNAAAVSADGARLVVGTSFSQAAGRGGDAFVLSADDGRELARWPSSGVSVFAADLSEDGLVAVGLRGVGTVWIWDLATRETRAVIPTGSGDVYQVAFSPDEQSLATAGGDGTVKVWDLTGGNPALRVTLPVAGGIGSGSSGVEFSADGSRLHVSAANGVVHTYLLEVDQLVELARSRVTRSLTEDECRTYLHREACPPSP